MRGTVSEFELVLRRVAQGARLIGLGWWATLAVLALAGGAVASTAGTALSVALAVSWGIVSSIMYRRDPMLATARGSLVVDLLLAVYAVTIAETQSGLRNLYGGMPILMVVVASIRGPRSTWLAAVTIAVVTGGDLFTEDEIIAPVSQILVYLAGAFIATWAIGILRSADERIRTATEALARSQERTRIFEHLHDSVLQTLALIQRASERPAEVVSLARRQERELREWLYGPVSEEDGGLGEAVRRVAADVEERYGVPVEVVVVGDTVGSPAAEALVGALREAAVNAAKHSGASPISVYVEAAHGRLTGFVRDRGVGFDPDSVAGDRRGISDSIRARVARVGGNASLKTEPGRGTEWSLEVPV